MKVSKIFQTYSLDKKDFNSLLFFFGALFLSSAALFQIEVLKFLLAAVLVSASIRFKFFWLLVVPTLIVYSGLEKTVFLDRSLFLETPLNSDYYPDLWVLCVCVRVASFWFSEKKVCVYRPLLVLSFIMLLLGLAGSLLFSINHSPLPVINKAPVKLIVFVLLSGAVMLEVLKYKNRLSFVWDGFVLATIAGAVVRIPVMLIAPVKDPGVYTFTGVFVASVMVFMNIRERDKAKVLFWIVVLFLHFSVSRTEIFLFSLSILVLIVKSPKMLGYLSIGGFLIFAFLSEFIPHDIKAYFYHKLSFFSTISGVGGDIGDSANVRLSTFINLVFGHQADIGNLLIGRGFWGYLDFQTYPDSAIYTEGAFSEYEHSTGKYFRLHFFLNEVIFYFGFLGVASLFLMLLYYFYRMRSCLEVVLLIYFSLNFMFRLELVILFPILLYVVREKLKAASV